VPYLEKQPNKKDIYLIIIPTLLLYLCSLVNKELIVNEAKLAAIAVDMITSGDYLNLSIHGKSIEYFPLYPWLISLCSFNHFPHEWTIRLPALFATFALATIAGISAYKVAGKTAATVAICIVLTSFISMQEGVRADSNTVFALLIVSAWFSWYHFGRIKKNWQLAWSISLTLILVATLVAGLRAIIIFYLPILFFKRPLRGIKRMTNPIHIISLLVVLLILSVWKYIVPGQTLLPASNVIFSSIKDNTNNYIHHLISFPIKTAIYLLPWTIIAWIPFCVAFQSLEKDRVYCRFLRTLILPLFFMFWIIPAISPRSLYLLIVPLAILTGINYELLIRRYHYHLNKTVNIILNISLYTSIVGVIIAILHITKIIIIEGLSYQYICSWLLVLIASAGLVYLMRKRKLSKKFWLFLFWTTIISKCILLSFTTPYNFWKKRISTTAGQQLAKNVPKNATIYRLVKWFMYTESFYMQRKVQEVESFDEKNLPVTPQDIYVLTNAQEPIDPRRKWTPISEPFNLQDRKPKIKYNWLPGGYSILKIELDKQPNNKELVRMYRGTLYKHEKTTNKKSQ